MIAGLGRCLDAHAIARWRGCSLSVARRMLHEMPHYGKGASAFTWETAAAAHLIQKLSPCFRYMTGVPLDPLEEVVLARMVRLIEELTNRGLIKLNL